MEALFPNGEVESLHEALNPAYDTFFETKVRLVDFERCEKGYIPESEGPVWDDSQAYSMVHEVAFD